MSDAENPYDRPWLSALIPIDVSGREDNDSKRYDTTRRDPDLSDLRVLSTQYSGDAIAQLLDRYYIYKGDEAFGIGGDYTAIEACNIQDLLEQEKCLRAHAAQHRADRQASHLEEARQIDAYNRFKQPVVDECESLLECYTVTAWLAIAAIATDTAGVKRGAFSEQFVARQLDIRNMTHVPASAETYPRLRRIADIGTLLEASWRYAQPPLQAAMAEAAANELRALLCEPSDRMQQVIDKAVAERKAERNEGDSQQSA